MVSDLRLAQACVAAAGRLRGVAAERLQPKALVEALVSERPLVGLEALPKGAALGAVRDPAVVALAQPPDVSIRQAAVDDWPKLTKKQSSWADYVYGKQPLFANRPVVFAAAAGDATASYLDHASTIAGAPFCCLRDADTLQAFVAAAGCAEVIEDAPDAQRAAAAGARVAVDGLATDGDGRLTRCQSTGGTPTMKTAATMLATPVRREDVRDMMREREATLAAFRARTAAGEEEDRVADEEAKDETVEEEPEPAEEEPEPAEEEEPEPEPAEEEVKPTKRGGRSASTRGARGGKTSGIPRAPLRDKNAQAETA